MRQQSDDEKIAESYMRSLELTSELFRYLTQIANRTTTEDDNQSNR